MNLRLLPLIISLPLLPSILIDPASAQCVQSHTGVQLDISKNHHTRQSNEVEMSSNPSCSGNTSSSSSTQTNLGGEGATQTQRARHSHSSSSPNPSGVNAPTIQNSVVVPVPVETPDTSIDFP
ncbi:hypothetical protein Sta7437_4845 (plasmid) [Stanieria cyanosphaera PCC 7437]|uniref:Uncharacterized protein n=1 Tax=Stanieria cyanosphaera (strain ATCC 29371 / PCC 7437) TaxID=111780 RepID=K9Y0L1_STAC7|nr:hypothetical protein [Stanieria cyanosphaera]AFZ38278.1 hypothetical protein Sta7437_4845 [Stanieria cyanosphaera PCC 7437]